MIELPEDAAEPAMAGLISRTAASLRDMADQLDQGTLLAQFEWVIPMSDIGSARMDEHCNAIAERLGKKQMAVYAICFDDAVPLDRVYDVVDGNKARNKALPAAERRAFARVNKRKRNIGSRCLYIGKSEKAAERIRQHLTEAHPATFAIHLNYWPNDIPGNLIVQVIGVSDVQSALVPFIEDQLANEMLPILGRRGSV